MGVQSQEELPVPERTEAVYRSRRTKCSRLLRGSEDYRKDRTADSETKVRVGEGCPVRTAAALSSS